jgi:hypothetical protein
MARQHTLDRQVRLVDLTVPAAQRRDRDVPSPVVSRRRLGVPRGTS